MRAEQEKFKKKKKIIIRLLHETRKKELCYYDRTKSYNTENTLQSNGQQVYLYFSKRVERK